MKRVVIAVATALPLMFAVPAFAIEGSQPPRGTAPDFEQTKAYHLKRLDERLNSLQQEKVCVEAAKSQDDLRACRAKHKAEMKGYRGDIKKMRGPGGMGGQIPPESN